MYQGAGDFSRALSHDTAHPLKDIRGTSVTQEYFRAA